MSDDNTRATPAESQTRPADLDTRNARAGDAGWTRSGVVAPGGPAPDADAPPAREAGERLGAGTADIIRHIEHHHTETTALPPSPMRGEEDPREVDIPDLQIPQLGPAIDGIVDAWAPAGSDLHAVRDNLRWGIVNTLYSQTTKLQHQANNAALALADFQKGTPDEAPLGTPTSEVGQKTLEEAVARAQRLQDRLAALERLHHAATVHYRQRTGETWRPHSTRRSYVSTQQPYPGSYSTGRDVSRANRLAAELERDLQQAAREQQARSRAASLERAREDDPRPAGYDDGPYVAPPPVPDNAWHVVVAGDREYPHLREVSNALERLRAKHPDLVVNALAGTHIGDFVQEWADLHGVPSRAIGHSSLTERPDLSIHQEPTGETIPARDDPTRQIPLHEHVANLEHPTSRQIARREGAILDLGPRVIMTFGDDRYESRPYAELAAQHNFPLWSFDNEGKGTAYQGGAAPVPEQRVRTRAPVYAGIGARETPPHVQDLMRETAHYLAEEQYTLRSGGARGADQAFETGTDLAEGAKTIFIPEDGFRGRRHGVNGASTEIPELAFTIAAEQHGNWNGLTDQTKRLHARNSLQVLGQNLDHPADVVICWTRDGAERGGTGQATRLAKAHNIPIINLGAENAPTTPEEVFERVRESVLPWKPGDLDQGIDSERAVAPPAPDPIPEYDADKRAAFEHTDATLKHANQHFNRLLHVVGPDGTQLSDCRAALAWGLVNVLDYQTTASARRFEKAVGADDQHRAGREYAGLHTLKTGVARHYSGGLRLGPWTARGQRPNPGQSYAQLQANALLAKHTRSALEQHRLDHARILVDGTEKLTFNEYDRINKLLKNVRQWHLDNENRDIVVVHKNPQSVLQRCCENNDIHQHIYFPNFNKYGKKLAPSRRDHDMVHENPPHRFIQIETPEGNSYTRNQVENYNRRAREEGRPPIRIQRAVPATALDPSNDTNVVAHPTIEPLRFSSRSEEGTIFSNFANTPIKVDGLEWASVEHYYQAAKLGAVRSAKGEAAWNEIRQSASPGQTKSLGGKVEFVPDWNDRRIGTMAEALCQKFAPGTAAAEELLGTGQRLLIHETNWGRNGDPFWGAGHDGSGRNLLGHMLENAREHLRARHPPILEKLLEPQGFAIADPAEARVGDFLAAHQTYRESYTAWTESFYGSEPGVADKRAAEHAANGAALSRATATFLANFDRYERFFSAEEFSLADLEKYNRMYQPQEQKAMHQQHEHQGELRA